MDWPQIVIIIGISANVAANLVLDGRPSNQRYSFLGSVIRGGFWVMMLHFGGFWQ